MSDGSDLGTFSAQLRGLRSRADEDYVNPPRDHETGRHQSELSELGLRVSVTRARYPNRPDGVEQYAVTLSRTALDRPPDAGDVRLVLDGVFGAAGAQAVERSMPGSRVRMFRVPAGAAQPSDS